jgi:hypothetical protein
MSDGSSVSERRKIIAMLAALFVCVAPAAFAEGYDDAPPAFDASRPAVGAWTGFVSWNDPPVTYAWLIDPDGTFASGRAGRGPDGGGAWGVHGGRLILKYANGFRYEGELRENSYAGTAYRANGDALGTFEMYRSAPLTPEAE